MMKQSIGLIETVGLAAGIVAADTAVKSANVEIIGYELSRGNGMTVIKIQGDVGAVKAAVESAVAAASQVSQVYSKLVIPRPSESLEMLMVNENTVGKKVPEKTPEEKKTSTRAKTTASKTSAAKNTTSRKTSSARSKADNSVEVEVKKIETKTGVEQDIEKNKEEEK